MWIASVYGWFSIVQKQGGICVRARCRGDLVDLMAASQVFSEVIENRETDYPFRIIVERPQLSKIMNALEQAVNYPNFKSKIATVPHQRAKLGQYHEIWAVMADVRPPSMG